MKISCLVVDDIKLNREIMTDLISGVDFLELAGTCENAMEAVNILNELEPDVLFLDIEMPGMSGLEFLKSLTNPPVAVLTTSHKEFAAEGFEMNVFDYMVKPITQERFSLCANRLNDLFKEKKKPVLAQQIFMKNGTKYLRVKLDEIIYVEAMRDFAVVHTEKGKLPTQHNLKEFTQHLPDDLFMRIHRSYVVPIGRIESIEGNMVKIMNHEIPIGESYKNYVLKTLLGKEG